MHIRQSHCLLTMSFSATKLNLLVLIVQIPNGPAYTGRHVRAVLDRLLRLSHTSECLISIHHPHRRSFHQHQR
jgi:hypothetical protein